MKKRFAYFYLMKREPARIQATVPAHAAYWKELNLKGYLGGPFADRSGGLITFRAENLEEAKRLIENDPFVQESLLEEKSTKAGKISVTVLKMGVWTGLLVLSSQ